MEVEIKRQYFSSHYTTIFHLWGLRSQKDLWSQRQAFYKSIVNDLTTKSLGNNFKEETLQNHCIQDNKNSFVNNKKHILNEEIKHFAAHYPIINH